MQTLTDVQCPLHNTDRRRSTMDQWNDNHFFTPLQKVYMLACGLLIAASLIWITHLYYEYRVNNAVWQTTTISPKEFWADVPKWEWKPIFTEES